MTSREGEGLDQHNFGEFELVQGEASDVFGLRLTDRDSGAVSIWWARDEVIAKLHGRIHWTLNLNNMALDEKAGIFPPGQYD